MSELYRIHQYDPNEFNFITLTRVLLGESNLEKLSTRHQLITRKTDQNTFWHSRFYTGLDQDPLFLMTYRAFVQQVIALVIGEPFYWQKIPTLRIHLRDNLAVGEFHTDKSYNHPDGETNFWVPLTRAFKTATIQLEMKNGDTTYVALRPGLFLQFDANEVPHGNKINRELISRVSFDFRILPVRFYVPSEARTINTGVRFAPGEYYSKEIMG